jgi:hypothetical protein
MNKINKKEVVEGVTFILMATVVNAPSDFFLSI